MIKILFFNADTFESDVREFSNYQEILNQIVILPENHTVIMRDMSKPNMCILHCKNELQSFCERLVAMNN